MIDDAPVMFKENRNMTFNVIEHNVHIGYNRLSKLRSGYAQNAPVKIGENVHIRSGTTIYAGCEIGDNVHIGHNVVLREFTKVGDNSSIGTGVVCEGYTQIGHHTTVHAQTHLTALMFIGDYVFIGPKVTTANDRFPRYYRPNRAGTLQGPFICSEAIICAGAVLLPQVRIGDGAIVGAGSIVTKDVDAYTMVFGNPAKFYRNVQDHEKVNRNPEQQGATWR